MKKALHLIVVVSLLGAVTLAQGPAGKGTSAAGTAAGTINADDILRHIKTLSSDEFEGRGPGTKGEDLSVQYLTDQFKKIGLKPGNPDGTYVQKVPLVGFTTTGTARLTAGGKEIALKRNEDYVAISRRFTPQIDVNDSEIVFVGYGVVAPEYGWDDYKGVDVRGKTIVMLVNDPAVPDPNDPTKKDPAFFKGNAMTYYGRWTYKYEIAAEKGAAAAIIVHDTIPAGYPFEVVTGSWGRENFDIQTPDKNMGRAAVESWISNAKARELMTASGEDLDALQRAAVRKDFKPVALNARATFHLQNQLRYVDSRNVIAKLEGSDAKAKNEYVIYSAHWDHLGKDPNRQGDQIFNGAIDNASGCAGLLELAEAYAKLPAKPKRSVLFLAVTAEEKGLLGSKYYASNPLYPLNKTLANINMDGLNQWGRTKDVLIVGYGNSTLDDVLKTKAADQNRTVGPEQEPEKGTFYRSDHFEFAKQGVPALYVHPGDGYIGKAPGYAQEKRDQYTANDYHKPSDEIKPDWDLSGAVEDLQLLFAVGYDVAQGSKWPEWKPGTEFKAKRDASLRSEARPPQRLIRFGQARSVPMRAELNLAHVQNRSSAQTGIHLETDVEKVETSFVAGRRVEETSPGLTIVALAVKGLDDLPGPLTFQYKVSGGKVIGDREEVKWDLTGVPPGVYTASVDVSSNGEVFTDTRELEVQSRAVSAAREETADQSLANFRANFHGDDANGYLFTEWWGRRPRSTDPILPPNHPPVVKLTVAGQPLSATGSDKMPAVEVGINQGPVTLISSSSDPDGDSILLTYTATAGRIIGEGPVVQWDLMGVEPGKYSATVEANDGCGCIDWRTVEVTVTG